MIYRREIDGLRALAIVPVIIFHFFPSELPLGYLGVDLFFVISGYLITCILINELDTETFTFSGFYARRVRRILPAALLVLIATSLFALVILSSPDLLRYVTSLISTLTFTANIYFWRTGGYFSTNDELKPLLHMWSLGVEEQFYLLFPILLFVLFKLIKLHQYRLLAISFFLASSFILNIYILSIGGANPAFFLLPTRIWQFAIGAFIALASRQMLEKKLCDKKVMLLGIFLICANYFFIIPTLPSATLMSIGIGLLLWHRVPYDTVVGRLLTIKPVVFLGLISFSLYLWHWPILVFLRYIYIQPPPLIALITGIVLTLFLSYLSWKFIEVPFRKTKSKKSLLLFIVGSYLTLLTLFGVTTLNDGFPTRHSQSANNIANSIASNYRCSTFSFISYGGSIACLVGDESSKNYSVALYGNSHALMYAPAFISVLEEKSQSGLIVPSTGCLPTTDINISTDCLSLALKNYEAIVDDEKIKTVIIALTWYENKLVNKMKTLIKDEDFSIRKQSLINLIRGFEKAGKKVFLIGPISIPNFNFASVVSRQLIFNEKSKPDLSISKKDFDKKFAVIINELETELSDQLILPHRELCDDNTCYFGSDKMAYFADTDHLSYDGAMKMKQLFKDIMWQ
jgi:peptidoglycan/LPS O-acetylase OafA/YrhL